LYLLYLIPYIKHLTYYTFLIRSENSYLFVSYQTNKFNGKTATFLQLQFLTSAKLFIYAKVQF